MLQRTDDLEASGFTDLRFWLHHHHSKLYPGGVPIDPNYGHFRSIGDKLLRYPGFNYTPPNIKTWCKNESLWERDGRFPSVKERIKLYMGKWYNAKPQIYLFGDDFANKTKDKRQYKDLYNVASIYSTPQIYYPNELNASALHKTTSLPINVRNYLVDYIDLAIIHKNKSTPVLLKFADCPSPITNELNLSFPVFGKVRDLLAEKSANNSRYSNFEHTYICSNPTFCGVVHDMILWPLNQPRHFAPVAVIPKVDIPWEQKIAKLVYRGNNLQDLPKNIPFKINSAMHRHEAVLLHKHSSLVSAKFSGGCNMEFSLQGFCGKLNQGEMLKYKYILSIQGNDVSSGLKWMLFSNSVVFLPPITYESWAMESLLKPFVHYIPVNSNMTNLESMVQWAENHPDELKQISVQSTLFIYDLLFHPRAYIDDELVKIGIMERYEENFRL